ncbi:MAG: hypothetical protein FJW31_20110 [Acidobacteria bacterium]|nr:hypothetical protein [Acidobacteriota bacterium]
MRRPVFTTILPLLPLGFAVFLGAAMAQEVSIPGRLYEGSGVTGKQTVKDDAVSPAAVAARLAKRAPEVTLAALDTLPSTQSVTSQPAHRVGRVRDLTPDAVSRGEWATLPDGRQV